MDDGEPRVDVRRSGRRRRTVSAYRGDDGAIVVLLPARLSDDEESSWVEAMVERVHRAEQRRRPDDATLARRAEQLSTRYLHGLARPTSVRWVRNQEQRWGSCTPADRAIRLSKRLQGMPPWVIDYVLLHELTHLLEPGHTRAFWRMVDQMPKAERARGFLEGVAYAAHLRVRPQDVLDGDCVEDGLDAWSAPARSTREASPAQVDQFVQ